MIIYKEQSLFDAPKGSLLVHACNARGVWGSGIAKEFKRLFPKSYQQYNKFCQDSGVGYVVICKPENEYQVGCLITSNNYGKFVDEPQTILNNTRAALNDLMNHIDDNVSIYSNMFNSGLFNVPWEQTEKLIKQIAIDKYGYNWVVCNL